MKGRLGLMVTFLVAAGGALLLAPERAPGRQTAAAVFPGGPYYVIGCGFSHRSNDDPIRYPNQPGKLAQPHVRRQPDDGRLVDAGRPPRRPRSCGDDGDASAYWVPTLFDGATPVRPLVALAYYVKRTYEPIHSPGGAADARRQLDGDQRQSRANVVLDVRRRRAPGRSATVRHCARRPLQCGSSSRTAGTGTRRQRRPQGPHGVRERWPVPRVAPGAGADGDADRALPAGLGARSPPSGRFAAHADFMNGWDAEVLGGQVAALNRSRPPDG